MARFHVGAVAIVVASCSWIAGLDDPLPAPVDGGARGSSDGPVGASCYGSNLATVCFDAAPTGVVAVPTTIDTGQCANAGVISAMPAACVIAGSDLTVGDVTATGSAPLVLVATGAITVTGTIDVSTHSGKAAGAGADYAGCTTGMPAGSGGGGAGGSYAEPGGVGGALGGTPGMPIPVSPLHAGCPGENGEGTNDSTAGHGGGAVYLIASQISVATNAAIFANGEGAAGTGCSGCGGGGGGTGGTIGLDATTVTVANGASLCAVGGGGGQGAGSGSGLAGGDGTSCAGGLGGDGPGSGFGGPGGNGGDTGSAGTGYGSGSSGGGGGGGSYGAIRIFAGSRNVDSGATIIPAAP